MSRQTARVVATIALVAVLAGGIAYSSTRSSSSPAAITTTAASSPRGSALVYARIAAETDCAMVQHEFDVAMSNHDRLNKAGDFDRAMIATDYAQAAYDRQDELGCFSD